MEQSKARMMSMAEMKRLRLKLNWRLFRMMFRGFTNIFAAFTLLPVVWTISQFRPDLGWAALNSISCVLDEFSDEWDYVHGQFKMVDNAINRRLEDEISQKASGD